MTDHTLKDVFDIRAEIVAILGLETSPDGEPNHLLTYDDQGRVIEGTDWSEEVDDLVALFDAYKANNLLP